MLQVGLTGNIGSGKTTVCRVFEILGVPVYYADLRARAIMEKDEVVEQVAGAFGREVLDENGQLKRKVLAALVFNNKEKLERLNAIVHPLVREDYSNWASTKLNHAYVMQEAAILFETGMAASFDKVIVVAAPLQLRIARVQQRDGVGREEVLRRAANQFDEKILLEKADFVIHNDDSQLVIPQVLAIDRELRRLQQF
ncbi:MAG: dephospho-CoA kinase [Bacteroidales bacterium]|nr:dephospho-CoA kinase [Bacteroidales bacterium]